MSGYVLGECADLFDPATGEWKGVLNRAGEEQLVGTGGSIDLAAMEAAAAASTDAERREFLLAAGAAEFRSPITVNTDFTLTSDYANRRTDCTKGSAQAVSWSSGHGMADGDSGRLMQVGAGAITITKDGGFAGGELKLATGVASATTVNDGDVLDWEYDATGERLLITYRSAASAGGTLKSTPYSDGLGTQAFTPGNTTEFTLSSITIPANKIGANGWVQFIGSAERTAGVGSITLRIRLGNATTGTQVASPAAGSRVTFEGLLASLNSTSSHRSGAPTSNTIGGTGVTVTDTTASTADITFYLTGQLATGTDTLTRYYFKAIVHNPDA